MNFSGLVVRVLSVVVLASRLSEAQASLTGTVFDSLRTNAPLKGATVVITELARYATTDARGRFRIDSLPAGHVSITFMHPALDSLDMAAEVRDLTVPERGTLDTRLTTPSPATAYARLCPGARDLSTGVLLGRVRDVDDAAPVAGAIVSADWKEYALEQGRMHGRVVRVSAATNGAGVYLLCGVPGDVAFQVFGLAGGQAAGPVPVVPDSRLLARLDLSISRRDSAARLSVAELVDTARRGAPLASVPGSATISGRVVSAAGQPIPIALIGVIGADLSARADSAGRFRLAAVPAGTRAIVVRAIGLAPTTVVLAARSGGAIDTVIRVGDSGQLLAEVSVLATRPTLVDRTGFAERVKVGNGHFLTQADIERSPAPDLYGFLERVPELTYNITVVHEQIVRRVLMRGGSTMGSGFCAPSFFLDGMYYRLDDGPEPLQSLTIFAQTVYLKGIEVYRPGTTIPPQFDRSSSTGCGSVVIWTK